MGSFIFLKTAHCISMPDFGLLFSSGARSADRCTGDVQFAAAQRGREGQASKSSDSGMAFFNSRK
jgi:hypothetical protein